jgi:hypothetical protein
MRVRLETAPAYFSGRWYCFYSSTWFTYLRDKGMTSNRNRNLNFSRTNKYVSSLSSVQTIIGCPRPVPWFEAGPPYLRVFQFWSFEMYPSLRFKIICYQKKTCVVDSHHVVYPLVPTLYISISVKPIPCSLILFVIGSRYNIRSRTCFTSNLSLPSDHKVQVSDLNNIVGLAATL